ncbi:MAG: hypothetical protein DDG60_13625 [Anaerolineae bacterium]|nr:MAG: hypothetical protein DDG60_13625 [Anaerolineae bacterium]
MLSLNIIVRLMRPIHLLLALLAYGLGLGIARYLGGVLNPLTQIATGMALLFLLAASSLLVDYFRRPDDPILPAETRQQREVLRPILLAVSAAFLAVGALLAFWLYLQGHLTVNNALLFVLYLLLCLSLAVPPVRLIERGIGEIVLAFLLAVLTPAIAFLLMFPGLHPFLRGFTFPLFLLALAWQLAISFEQYPNHLKYGRRVLLVRLSWQKAIPLHNSLLVAAYFFLAMLPFLSVPFHLTWPALLTLPLAAWQALMLRNIADGAKPVWNALNIAATAVFGLTSYLITITFWLR